MSANSDQLLPSKLLEWGAVILFAFQVAAAVWAYLARDLSWFHWAAYAFMGWLLIWIVLTKIKDFREGWQHGGVGGGIRRVLPRVTRWRIVTIVVILVAAVVWIWYLPGTPWNFPFTVLFIVLWLGALVWGMVTGLFELRRERRITLGAIRAMICLFLLSIVALSTYETGSIFGGIFPMPH